MNDQDEKEQFTGSMYGCKIMLKHIEIFELGLVLDVFRVVAH